MLGTRDVSTALGTCVERRVGSSSTFFVSAPTLSHTYARTRTICAIARTTRRQSRPAGTTVCSMAKCYCEHGGSLAFHVLSFAVHATYGDALHYSSTVCVCTCVCVYEAVRLTGYTGLRATSSKRECASKIFLSTNFSQLAKPAGEVFS